MSLRITCINKDNGNHENPYTAITHLGWVNESNGHSARWTRLEMYQFVKDQGEAYVKDNYGNKGRLIACETEEGTEYVKTAADGVESDNLLLLPECEF